MRGWTLAQSNLSIRDLPLILDLLTVIVRVNSGVVRALRRAQRLNYLWLLRGCWRDWNADLTAVARGSEMTTAVVKRRRYCYRWHVCLLKLLLLVLVRRSRIYDAIWRHCNFLQHWLGVDSFWMFLGILGDLSWVTLVHLLLVVDVANHARIHWLPMCCWLVYWAHLLSYTIIGTLTSVLAG